MNRRSFFVRAIAAVAAFAAAPFAAKAKEPERLAIFGRTIYWVPVDAQPPIRGITWAPWRTDFGEDELDRLMAKARRSAITKAADDMVARINKPLE